MSEVTRILSQIEAGDPQAAENLLVLVYDELRKLATAKLAQEKPGQTLQATALVHEAYVRLVSGQDSGGRRQESGNWNSRGHFFGAAAEAMRRILVESARRKGRVRHGGNLERVELEEAVGAFEPDPETILAVDEALAKLAKHDPACAELVNLHFFAGLTLDEAAEALGISRATTYRTWSYARAFLRLSLRENGT